MKTIKINEDAFITLNSYKYHEGKRNYSETIIHMHEVIKDLAHFKYLYLKEHEK